MENINLKEILCQQLELLAEKSKNKDISAHDLCNLSSEMIRLSEVINSLTSETM